MSTRLRLATCLVLLACTLSAPALGDEPRGTAAASPSGEAAVTEHVRRGDKARNAGRWAEAAAAYLEAITAAEQLGLSEEKRAAIIGEFGLCELAMGKYRDAAEHLHVALRKFGGLPPAQRQRFLQGQRKAESEVVVVFVGLDPPDAELFVDGKPHAPRWYLAAGDPGGAELLNPDPEGTQHQSSSYEVFVDPGMHTFRGRLSGYLDDFEEISAPRGAWLTITLHLVENPSKPSPPARADIPPAPRRAAPRAAPPVPPSTSTAIAGGLRWAGVITTSAAALGGTAFAIAGTVVDDDLERRSQVLAREIGPKACLTAAFKNECESLRSMGRTRDVLDGVAVGSFIAAATVGALTLSSLWLAPSERPRTRIQVTPTATAKQAGAVVSGVW